MNKLDEKRLSIDLIDQQMTNLFEQRMNIVKDIALYKKENNLPIFNEEREKVLINKNLSFLNNEEFKSYYLEFINKVLSLSKEYQNEITKNESKK